MARVVNFSITHDDGANVTINSVTVYNAGGSGSGNFSGKHYVEIILNDIGGYSKLEILVGIILLYLIERQVYLKIGWVEV